LTSQFVTIIRNAFSTSDTNYRTSIRELMRVRVCVYALRPQAIINVTSDIAANAKFILSSVTFTKRTCHEITQ